MTQTVSPINVRLTFKKPWWLSLVIKGMWLRYLLTGREPTEAEVQRLGRAVADRVRVKAA